MMTREQLAQVEKNKQEQERLKKTVPKDDPQYIAKTSNTAAVVDVAAKLKEREKFRKKLLADIN